jgi:hypothetical protein
MGYDDCVNVFTEDVPVVLQGKEELIPNFLPLVYWNMYFNNSTYEWRINNNLTYQNVHSSFYLPVFSFYYDYDFRNWQSLELLEDSFWESVASLYAFEEYASIATEFKTPVYFDKFDQFYNYRNRNLRFKDSLMTQTYIKNTSIAGSFYANSFYTEDFVSPADLLNTAYFSVFPLINSSNTWDDSYESSKYLKYLYNVSYKTYFNMITNFFQPHPYSIVFDMFRADYEEFSWIKDDLNNNADFGDVLSLFAQTNLLLTEYGNFETCRNKLNFNFLTTFIANASVFDFNQTFRFNNYINLRNTVRNSIVTYNAIQKVFRSRFDEGRSNAKMLEFSNFYLKQPYLTTSRVQYEHLLGKTRENFFKANLYKSKTLNLFNNLYDVGNSLNFYL